MTDEINVISRSQIIQVDPVMGSVALINAGPAGPPGADGTNGSGSVRHRHMMPYGAILESFPRAECWSGDGAFLGSSQELALYAVTLEPGDNVTGVAFVSGSEAGSGLTNTWCSLFTADFAKIAASPDNTDSTWDPYTQKTFTFVDGAFTIVDDALYFVGICMNGTSLPSFIHTNISGPLSGIPPEVSGLSNVGLTNAGSCPSLCDPFSSSPASRPYFYLY